MAEQLDNPLDGRGEAQEAQPMDAKWRAVLCREIGVWHVEGPHACFGIRTELATVWRAGGGAEERARLMAAAPELLAALRVLTDAHEMLYHPKDRIRQQNKAAEIAMARAAIARVEAQ
jgi:hypothetical protein